MYAFLMSAGNGDGGSVREQVQTITETSDQIVLAILGILATLVAALVFLAKGYAKTKVAAEQATQANQAVNNVGPGEHRMYDMVTEMGKKLEHISVEQEEFQTKGWKTLPDDLASASRLTETIRSIQHNDEILHQKLDMIIKELREHVEWEIKAKYGTKGSQHND